MLLGVGLLLFVIGFAIYAWEINHRGDRAVRQMRVALKDREIHALYLDTRPKPDDEGLPR